MGDLFPAKYPCRTGTHEFFCLYGRQPGGCVECSPRYPAAGKSNQDTWLLLSLPALHPAEMGSLCVETAWLLQGVDCHSQQACLPLFRLELPVGILDTNDVNMA